MSLNRYATKRDLNERPIVDALRAVGATVVQLDKPVDLLVGFRRETFLLEVKQPKGRLTDDQEEFFVEWQGGQLFTVRSVEQALACIGATSQSRVNDNRESWETGPHGVSIGPRIPAADSQGEPK
ncbi:MAG: hypothetical protein KDA27_27680 [Candidatus Eisenbacteria bacterium]|uniref:VRR-NUC domain-containing protein n=1 Tax=Eiseniibacteriota bacterium TaxID=2212470 RepID=A0A956SIJ5_UNCEI|nr:hypothetical protein [Candidatus Eisenbacteria bacterium]